MAYDATLLAAIDAAIASLVAGTRTVMLTMGDKTIQYGQTNLTELRALRDSVAEQIAQQDALTPKPRYVVTRTRKGL